MARLRPHHQDFTGFEYIGFSFRPKRKLNELRILELIGVAGHRARDPPDPVPKIWAFENNAPIGSSEVKLRSVSGVSVVFGHAKPGKLAAPMDSIM